MELINGDGDEWTVGVGGTGTFGIYNSSTFGEQFTMDTDGNVGIGTNSPGYKLNILTDTNYDGISLRDSTRELLKISKGNNGAYINMFESGTSKVNIATNGNSYLTGGNFGIGTTGPNSPLHIVGSDTNANAHFTSLVIDHNCSGGGTNTGDYNHTGILIDLDSTATGGNTSNEHRIYGIRSDTRHSGDSDLCYGVYSYTRSDHSSGTNTNLRAGDFNAVASGTGTNTNIYGLNSYALKDGGSTGTTTNMFGVRAEVEVDAGTCTYAYAYQAHIDRDGGTITTGYLYYGSWSGNASTKWGIYLTGENMNYFSGSLRLGGSVAPAYKLDVGGDVRGDMFIANNPSSGDGDDYAIGTLESDYSAWINIFNNGWISGNNGWGTFWAGNSGARYRRVSSDNNPNEYVFVGAGNKRCTFDLDNGHTYLDGTLHNNSYDYAEYFEWEDGNPENEDRRGYSVVLVSDGKIRKATSDDSPEDIIGAVSGTSSITGDAAMYDWNGKYEVDEWGTRIKDKVYQLTWEVELEDGEKQNHSYDEDRVPEGIIVPENASRRLRSRERINPEYDETRIYEPRDKRKEWTTIGLLGKVRVRDESPKHPNWKYLKTIAGKKLWLIK